MKKHMMFYLGTNRQMVDELVPVLERLGYNSRGWDASCFYADRHLYIVAQDNGDVTGWSFPIRIPTEEDLTYYGRKQWEKDLKHLTPLEEVMFWKDPNSVFDRI